MGRGNSGLARTRGTASGVVVVEMKWILPLLAALLAALAVLPLLPVRDSLLGWKLTLVATEFGHWGALGALALVAGAAWGRGPAPALAGILGAVALVGFLRPVYEARQLAARAQLAPPSLARLFVPPAGPRAALTTEQITSPDGPALPVDLYGAGGPAAGTRSRGCVVVIHGGGWDGGDRTQLAEWNHRWVAEGWLVAAISYRLAPAHRWPAPREDVARAIAWLKAEAGRLGWDGRTLVLLGRSAGGQIATAVGCGERDPAVRGVIALYAPHDLPFAWSVSREDDALNSVKLFRQYLGGPPDTPERLAQYQSASGQWVARADSPPVLLVHGRPDTLVWYRHSRRFAARLAELGVTCRHLELPWATHGFDFNPHGPGGQLAGQAIADFLRDVAAASRAG